MENIPYHQDSRQAAGGKTRRDPPASGHAFGHIWSSIAGIVGLAVIGALLGAFVSMRSPEKYTSTALLLVSPIEQAVLGYNPATTGLSAELYVLDTQIQLMRSPAHVQRVAEYLRARRDADDLYRLVREDEAFSDLYATAPEDALRQYIMQNLTVRQEGRADVIGVSFLATDPEVAALVANAVGEAFISEQVSMRSSETERIRQRLAIRVAALGAEARRASALVQAYTVDFGLLLSREAQEQGLSDLAAQLVGAASELVALDDQLAQLRTLIAAGRALEAAPAVAESPRVAELETTDPTDESPAVDPDVTREIARVEGDLKLSRNAAAARVDALRVAVAEQRQALSDRAAAEVELDILERDAAAAADMYSLMLRRLDEVVEEGHFIEPDTRFVSAATPSRQPATPGLPLLAALGAIAFAVLGAVMALFIGARREAQP